MIVEYPVKPSVIIEDLEPRFGPIAGEPLKMRAILSQTTFDIDPTASGQGLSFNLICRMEHYLASDTEKKTLIAVNGETLPEAPYNRRVYVDESGTAYRNTVTSELVKPTPEELVIMEADQGNHYMKEFEWFVYLHNTQSVILKEFETSIIMDAYSRGNLY